MYQEGFLKVLNLRVFAPLSRLALIVVACLASEWLSKRSEFAGAGFVAWLASEWLSKSSEFAGVGSAVEVGFLL